MVPHCLCLFVDVQAGSEASLVCSYPLAIYSVSESGDGQLLDTLTTYYRHHQFCVEKLLSYPCWRSLLNMVVIS